MGRAFLIARLALRDLRHRPAQAMLLLLAISAASPPYPETGFVAVLTAVPARVGARKPVVLTLRSGQP